MSLITISEATVLVGDRYVDDPDGIRLLVAAFSASLEQACNRKFAMRVSELSVSGGNLTFTVPVHRLRVGDTVHVTELGGGSLEGYHVVTAVTRDTFVIATAAVVTDADSVTVRKVLTQVKSTRGGQTFLVNTPPLAAIFELSKTDGQGGWTIYGADEYVITDQTDGLSFSGEVSLLQSLVLPVTCQGKSVPNGVRIQYVAGEPWPPDDLVYAMKGLVAAAGKRMRSSGFQSESYEYYSYSRLSAAEIGQLFGDADRIIRDNKLAVI